MFALIPHCHLPFVQIKAAAVLLAKRQAALGYQFAPVKNCKELRTTEGPLSYEARATTEPVAEKHVELLDSVRVAPALWRSRIFSSHS